jgi:hypothetical protein
MIRKDLAKMFKDLLASIRLGAIEADNVAIIWGLLTNHNYRLNLPSLEQSKIARMVK